MIDGGEGDDKIIAVAADDISVNHLNDITDLPPSLMAEIKQFFEDYKKLENKMVQVKGFGNKETAMRIVLQAIKDYKVMADELTASEKTVECDLQEVEAA
jgi:inorganic pyrophosphatase